MRKMIEIETIKECIEIARKANRDLNITSKADGDVEISFNIPTMFENRSTSRPREEYEEISLGDRSIMKVANNDNNEM